MPWGEMADEGLEVMPLTVRYMSWDYAPWDTMRLKPLSWNNKGLSCIVFKLGPIFL